MYILSLYPYLYPYLGIHREVCTERSKGTASQRGPQPGKEVI